MSITLNASTSSGFVQSADNSGEIELQSNGTTALKVNTNEGIQILNCLGVGNATPSTSGAGITFPATQSASTDANTLDDYEEGTWTPVDASGAGLVFSASGGRYVKIGRMVYFAFRAQYPSTSNTSQAQIGGLPYTSISSSAGSYDMGGFATQGLSQNYSQSYMAGIPPNSAQMDRVMNLQSSSSVALNNASLSNQNIYLWGWYYANA